jgi:hypothetical protein
MEAIAWVDRSVAELAVVAVVAVGTALPVLAVLARTAAILGESGLAAVPPPSPPLAATAATANAGAARAMVNRDVDVRFSDRERYKVTFSAWHVIRVLSYHPSLPDHDHFIPARALPVGRPRHWHAGGVAGSRRQRGYDT